MVIKLHWTQAWSHARHSPPIKISIVVNFILHQSVSKFLSPSTQISVQIQTVQAEHTKRNSDS